MNEKKKKIAEVVAAAAASLGLMVASAFSTPTDLLENLNNENEDDHNLIVELTQKEVKRKSFVEKIPYLLRAMFAIPFWLIGTLLLKLINGVIKLALAPIIAFLLTWLFIFLILFIVVIIVLKLLFPNVPIKELITKKLIICLLLSSLAMAIIDFTLKHIWDNYNSYRFLIIFLLGLISIGIVILPIVIKKSREPRLVVEDLDLK